MKYKAFEYDIDDAFRNSEVEIWTDDVRHVDTLDVNDLALEFQKKVQERVEQHLDKEGKSLASKQHKWFEN